MNFRQKAVLDFEENQINLLLKELKKARNHIKKYKKAIEDVKDGKNPFPVVGDWIYLSSVHVSNASKILKPFLDKDIFNDKKELDILK